MRVDISGYTRPVNPPAGVKTYARTRQPQQTYHALLNAVVDIPAGTRVEVLAVTASKFFGLYREGAADCIVQGPISDFEACPPETPAEFRERGLAALMYLDSIVRGNCARERSEAEWEQLSERERAYSVGAAARMKLRTEQREKDGNRP